MNAGYEPREAPQVFQILLKEYGDQAPIVNFFWGSHPTNTSRFNRTNELIESRYADAGAGLIVNTEEFKRRTREVVIAMGIRDYEEKRFNTAQAMFEKAAPVSEDDAAPHYYLGKIALETGGVGEIDKAIAHFKTGIKADPEFSSIYRELGLTYYRKGDRPKAVKAFERYLALEPGTEDAEQVRKYIRELKRY